MGAGPPVPAAAIVWCTSSCFFRFSPHARRAVACLCSQVFSDLLTDLAMAAHPLGPGSAHWGMTHAAHHMLQQDAARVGGEHLAAAGTCGRAWRAPG